MPNYTKLSTKTSTNAATAMLLAAGRGQRMMPLTANQAKPLLLLAGKPIIQWQLEQMQHANITAVIINVAWCKDNFYRFCADLRQNNRLPKIILSDEGELSSLETAGGVVKALDQLATAFWLTAADIYAPDFSFKPEIYTEFVTSKMLAKIWLVPNPEHHPTGDFSLTKDGLVSNQKTSQSYTYGAIGLFKGQLFRQPWCHIPSGNPQHQRLKLVSLLRQAAEANLVAGEIYRGSWSDVGTPERLATLNHTLTPA